MNQTLCGFEGPACSDKGLSGGVCGFEGPACSDKGLSGGVLSKDPRLNHDEA